MIIAITAAPIVDRGKCADVLKKKHSCRSVEDPMKECCTAYGFQTIYDMPASLQKKARTDLLYDHLNYLKGLSNNIILEYSVVEWVADWMRWFWGKTTTDEWNRVTGISRECLTYYDQIYHLEGGKRRSYDGYFWLDAGNSRQINDIMKYLYKYFEIENKIMLSSSRDGLKSHE